MMMIIIIIIIIIIITILAKAKIHPITYSEGTEGVQVHLNNSLTSVLEHVVG